MSGRFETLNDLFNVAVLNGGFTIPVATENVAFDPKAGTPFIAMNLLPLPVIQSSLGVSGCDKLTGILQLSVNYPQDQGMTSLLAKVDEVNQVFKAGAVFVLSPLSVTIKATSTNRVRVAQGFATIDLSIEYFSYTDRL